MHNIAAMATARTDDATRLGDRLQLEGIDYIRFLHPDMHGLLRGKLFQRETVNCAGEPIVIYSASCTLRGPELLLPYQAEMGYGNVVMRPLPDTYIHRSWRGNDHGAKVAQVMCELFYADGRPLEADVRQIARRQLDRLDARGLSICSGIEFEFRVYKQDGNGWVPGNADLCVLVSHHLNLYENFMLDMNKRMKRCKMSMYKMHSESGLGHLEVVTLPFWGIDVADHGVLFKDLLKETAIDNDLQASFMTMSILNGCCNSTHFNHSIWRRSEDSKESAEKTNVFRDPDKELGLSDLGRHWLAGLIHHAPGLTALCCPTVNCYRRLGTSQEPQFADWGLDHRFKTFRLKVGPDDASTYIENRLPSGPANLYLVLASTVAAGLDGVERELELPDQQAETRKELPRTLPAALDALKADSVICEALGKTFVDWFVFVKEEEIEHLRGVDVAAAKAEDMERERADYLFLV